VRTVEFQLITSSGRVTLPDSDSWDISPVADGTGTARIGYPAAGRNFALLRSYVDEDRDALVAVVIDGQQAPDLTVVLSEAKGDTADPAAVWDFTGRFQAVFLDQAVIYPDPDAGTVTTNGGLADAEREFSSMNAGEIIAPLMAEAQARGAASLVTYASFNSVHDSNGAAWALVTTTTCSPGVTMLALLNTLSSQGLLEWEMRGADLRLYNPGTLGTDRTLQTPPVILHGPRDLTSAPRTYSAKAAVTHLLVAGQQGLYTEADDPSAESRFGRRIEGYVSAGNIQDPGTLDAYAQNQLAQMSEGTLQVTHGLAMYGGPLPLDDFGVSDWVWSDTGLGLERYQVAQWSVSMDSDGVLTGTVTLNDLVAARAVKLQRAIDGITNGSAVVGTSTPPALTLDQIPPAAPTGLTASSLAFIDPANGSTRAQVTGGWTAPVTNADGSVLTDLAGFQVRWRYGSGQGLDTQWNLLPGTVPVGTNTLEWSPLVADVTVGWEVLAVDNSGNPSAWSAEDTLTTGADGTPPPVPTTPVVVPYLGQLKITWDGLGVGAVSMPPDFSRTEVHVSTITGFTPSAATLRDNLVKAGDSVATDLAYGTTYFVKLVSVDQSGNKSAGSAQASGVPVQAGNGDISALSVGKLTAGTLSAVVALSGRFVAGTALTGARVELNSSGFYLFDTDGTTKLVTIEAGNVAVTGTLTTKASSTGASRIEIGLDANGDTMRVFDSGDNQVVTLGQIYSGGTPVSNGIQVNNPAGDLIFRLYGSGTSEAQFFYVGKGNGTPYPYIQAHYDGVAAAMDFTLTQDDGNLPGHFVKHTTGMTFFDTGDWNMRVTTLSIMGIGVGGSPGFQNGQGPVTLNVYANGVNNPVTFSTDKTRFNFTGQTASAGGAFPEVNATQFGVDLTMNDGSGHGEGITALAGGVVTIRCTPELHVQNASASIYNPIFASAFNVVTSTADTKADIRPPDAGSGLGIIRRAPARMWRYPHDPEGTVRMGVMADDLPGWAVARTSPSEGREAVTGLSVANMLGVLQQAVYELDIEMDQFRKDKPVRKTA
jgi:hypothetical protein